MASGNKIIKDTNLPLTLTFSGDIDLTSFDTITATFNEDSRNTDDNPTSVIVNSSTELELNFQDTSESGTYYWDIIGTNVLYPDGYPLTSECLCNLEPTTTC